MGGRMVLAHITGPEETVKTAALILPLDHHLEGNNKYVHTIYKCHCNILKANMCK